MMHRPCAVVLADPTGAEQPEGLDNAQQPPEQGATSPGDPWGAYIVEHGDTILQAAFEVIDWCLVARG